MGIAMDLERGPDREFWRDIRETSEQLRFLDRLEQGQGLLAGGAMEAVAGLGQNPLAQLRVRLTERAELTQGQEGLLEVLHPGLNAAFQLRFAWWAGVDLEAVAFGLLGVGALHLGVAPVGEEDGAFGVVDDDPLGHAVEPREGMAVAGEPGGNILAPDQLGVLMPAEAERHDKDPGLAQLAGVGVEEPRTGAEVDLSGFTGGEVQAHGGLERGWLVGLEKTTDGE